MARRDPERGGPAASLMERLLSDADFRARFRADPRGALEEAGLGAMAQELSKLGDPMQTLQPRESRSSLAGAALAAAVEGIALLDPASHLVDSAQAATPPRSSQVGVLPPGGAVSPPPSAADPLGGSGSEDPGGLPGDAAVSPPAAPAVDPAVSSAPAPAADPLGGSDGEDPGGLPGDGSTSPVPAPAAAPGDGSDSANAGDGSDSGDDGGDSGGDDGGDTGDDGEDTGEEGGSSWDAMDEQTNNPESSDLASSSGSSSDATDEQTNNLESSDLGSNSGDGGSSSGDSGSSSGDSGSSSGDSGSSSGDSGSSSGDSGSSSGDSGSSSGDGSSSGNGGSDNSNSGSSSGDGGSDNAAGGSGSADASHLDAAVYPGDNAKPAQIAAWMGQEARRRGIPPELPIMASLTESGMQNLDHGDRDSLGYFQMRVSVWNGGPYAGYANNPKRQLDWFLDQAQAVGKQRQARGQSTTDPRQYGDWIADVERPAQEYRGRYQGHLAEARSLLAQSDNGQGKQGQGNQGVDQLVDAAASPGPGKKAVAALALVRKQMGTPYLWGGSSPKTGFDCSGLMQWAYAQVGVRIPRVTYDQIDAPGAQHIARNKLMPGDLVFFKNASGDVHHVGMSLGGDKFVHAPHTGDVVKISSLKDAYYAGQFTGGRRFVPAVAGGQNPAVGALAGVAGAHAAIDAPAPPRADVDAINAGAVKLAMAALEGDSREANRPGSLLHQLLTRQESGKGNAAMFLPAISAEP